jgi:ABC-2 type transport system ATP-binding protein
MARGIGYEGSRVNDLCASLSFDPGLLKRKVRHYSSGMRMKLALVRALNPDPDLIILDEPTNGLDPASVKDTRESIKRISLEMGKTILMTSHVIHEAKRCATRVGILKEGTIVHEGPIGPGGRAAFLRTRIECVPAAQAVLRSIGRTSLPDESRGVLRFEADQDEMPAVAASLAAAGVPIMAFGPEDDELERLFLRETGAMQ